MSRRGPPMSHDERIRLINTPFPTVRLYGGRQWGGASIGDVDKYKSGETHHAQLSADEFDDVYPVEEE